MHLEVAEMYISGRALQRGPRAVIVGHYGGQLEGGARRKQDHDHVRDQVRVVVRLHLPPPPASATFIVGLSDAPAQY